VLGTRAARPRSDDLYIIRRLLYVIPLVSRGVVVSLIFNGGLFGDPAATILESTPPRRPSAELRTDLWTRQALVSEVLGLPEEPRHVRLRPSTSFQAPHLRDAGSGAVPSLSITLPGFLIATTIAVSLSLFCAAFRAR